MSSTVFAKLTRDAPELKRAARLLDDWLDRQSGEFTHMFALSWPARELSSELSAVELAKIVGKVERSSDFQISYQVEDPEGNVVGPEYSSFLEIPREMVDVSGKWFKVEMRNVQQVIRIK